jgi:hypothetical protein
LKMPPRSVERTSDVCESSKAGRTLPVGALQNSDSRRVPPLT